MSRTLWAAAVSAALLFAPLACSRPDSTSPPRSTVSPGAAVSVSGSGTLLPMMQRLRALYLEDNPGAVLTLLPGTSTAGAVAGVQGGVLDVGLCSRILRSEERALGLPYYLLGYDQVVFAAHPSSRSHELLPKTLLAIYGGEITRWSQVGGADRGILVLDRDEGESVKTLLRAHFFGPAFSITPAATVFLHAEDLAHALETTPHSLGFACRGELRALGLDLKVAPPLGRWPAPEDVHSGAYPLSVPLGLVTAPDPTPETVRFLRFVRGPKGRSLLDALGCFPAAAGPG